MALASLLHHEPPGSAVQIRPWQWATGSTELTLLVGLAIGTIGKWIGKLLA